MAETLYQKTGGTRADAGAANGAGRGTARRRGGAPGNDDVIDAEFKEAQ